MLRNDYPGRSVAMNIGRLPWADGVPEILVTDQGAQLDGIDFSKFLYFIEYR